MQKKLVVLVMSVGPIERNGTAKYMERIGGKQNTIIVLPNQFEFNACGYEDAGFKTFIYDEKKYINKDVEYFGFRPCNCGGIGRQGIAEAVENFEKEGTICLQLDDDTMAMNIREKVTKRNGVHWLSKTITHFNNLEELMNAYDDFFKETGLKLQSATGCTPIYADNVFFSNRKIYNNFIMHTEDKFKFDGFKYLCSDDVIYNYTTNLLGLVPMLSYCASNIIFTQKQGDRPDGNAVIYNKDCSWKKSFSLRMFNPLFCVQKINKEENRILFRESLQYARIFPPIMLTDKNGNITHKLRIR